MGRMLDALKKIDSGPVEKPSDDILPVADAPEAELDFTDELLNDAAALLDELEKGSELEKGPESEKGLSQTTELIEKKAPLADEQLADEEPVAGESIRKVLRPWVCEHRHEDLAANILAQVSARTPTVLFFAATESSGVYSPSLTPLFSAIAERAGRRTLVVECDSLHAELAARFAIEPKAGLDEVLAGQADWKAAVCQSAQENLDVVCVSAGEYDADRDLTSRLPAFKAILEEMQREYRLVLLTDVSASRKRLAQMAALCHGTYLLIRAEQTPRWNARRSVSELKGGPGRLFGCILLDA